MIEIEIVTPEGSVYDDSADSVVIPTTTGEIGILPGHIPLITEVQAGEIAVTRESGVESLAVSKGFAQCVGDKISILAEHAISATEINESAVQEAQARAEAALKNSEGMSDEEVDMLETTIEYAKAQLLVRRKK